MNAPIKIPGVSVPRHTRGPDSRREVHVPAAPFSPTPEQLRALRFIRAYTVASNGLPPTFEEIREALGLASKSGVFRIVEGLTERGWLRRRADAPRSIEILHPLPISRSPDGRPLVAVQSWVIEGKLVFDGRVR